MEAMSARDGDFERDGDFDFGGEAPRTGDLAVFDLAGEDLDLAGEDLDLAGEDLDLTGEDLDLAGEDLDLAGEDLDLAGEAARARAGDFAVFDFGGIRQCAVARHAAHGRSVGEVTAYLL